MKEEEIYFEITTQGVAPIKIATDGKPNLEVVDEQAEKGRVVWPNYSRAVLIWWEMKDHRNIGFENAPSRPDTHLCNQYL